MCSGHTVPIVFTAGYIYCQSLYGFSMNKPAEFYFA